MRLFDGVEDATETTCPVLRPVRHKTTAVVVHHFGLKPYTLERMAGFFLEEPEGVATVTLSGPYAQKVPVFREWAKNGGAPLALRAKAFVPYHFVVEPSGRVAQTMPMESVGAHAAGANRKSVSVALLGTFSKEPPTAAALLSLRELLRDLLVTYGRLDIWGHDDVERRQHRQPKGCPGDKVPLDVLRKYAPLAAEELARRGLCLVTSDG